MLLLRALFAFAALPGVVAFVVPWLLLDGREAPFALSALVPLIPGVTLLAWCAGAFYARGRGTLAPWDPPQHLVVSGPYRFSRNPMYVAVVLILWSWAIALRSGTHAVYALGVMAAFHLRVVFAEEPWLARRHGEPWLEYKAHVPRWF